jgi:hypothetical protein
LSGKLWWQNLPGLQHARQCEARVREGHRWRRCKLPGVKGFWTEGDDGKAKYQLLKRPVCRMHGARGAALGHLSQTVKRTQLERDRLAREQRLETKRRRAALQERVADGAPVGARRSQPAPASATPLGDEFFRGRGDRPAPMAPLYPGSRR